MKREEVRQFLKYGADALAQMRPPIGLHFDSGRLSEFNSLRGKAEPFAWVESLKTNTNISGNHYTLIDEWDVVIHIARFDKPDSLQDQYEELIDQCDQIARKLIWQYNYLLYNSELLSTSLKDSYKLVTLDGISREPFIKKYADCMTGVILSFTLNAPDRTDVCP